MTRRATLLGAMAVVATLFVVDLRPAAARVRVFVGGAIGVPIYSYPYYPYYDPYPVVPYPYYVTPPNPPPGWVPGHWEWRYDQWGGQYRVWVPPHLW